MKEIENIQKGRAYLLSLLKDLSVEQLNETPAGFSNNIIWNLAHMVAAQQGVCYRPAGQKTIVEDKYWTLYKPGTKPEQFVDAHEIQNIKDLMSSTLDRLSADYEANIFANYTPWSTRYGAELATIDDAIAFLPFHEGIHAGTIMAIQKLVSK